MLGISYVDIVNEDLAYRSALDSQYLKGAMKCAIFDNKFVDIAIGISIIK